MCWGKLCDLYFLKHELRRGCGAGGEDPFFLSVSVCECLCWWIIEHIASFYLLHTFMSCSEMRSRLTLSDSESNSTRLMLLNSTSVEIILSLWLMTWLIPYFAPTRRLTNTSLSWSWGAKEYNLSRIYKRPNRIKTVLSHKTDHKIKTVPVGRQPPLLSCKNIYSAGCFIYI